MRRPVAHFSEVMQFDLAVERTEDEYANHIVPDDDGTIRALAAWMWEQGIVPARSGGAGPCFWHGAFWPDDAARVQDWLRARGIQVHAGRQAA